MTVVVFALLFLLSGCGGGDGGGDPGSGHPRIITTASGIEMVRIPAGWSVMGTDRGRVSETPAHRVWVDAFLMDRYEVTQERFRQFEISDPSHFQGEGLPVERCTWVDAARFCNERSLREALIPCYDEETWECDFEADGYRLPTEAEWEYASRAGSKGEYCFGDDPTNLGRYAWHDANSSGKTQQVGTRRPNLWGLFDLHGNVAEWCYDYFAADYYERSSSENPRGPAVGEERVVRGGAWNSSPDDCRTTARMGSLSVDDECLVSDAIGFRCVRRMPVDR